MRTSTEIGPGTVFGGRFRVARLLRDDVHTSFFLARDERTGAEVELEATRTRVNPLDAPAPKGLGGGYDPATGAAWCVRERAIDGPSLADLVRSSGPLEVRRGVEIASRVLAAVDALERAGERVEPPTPTRIRFDPSAGSDTPRIVAVSDSLHLAAFSGTTASPDPDTAFKSPEQLEEALVATPASRVYSVAACLYFMLTGEAPFKEKSAMGLFMAVHEKAPVPPSSLRAEIPPALDAAIRAALEKDPARRPPDARAFAARLKEAMAR